VFSRDFSSLTVYLELEFFLERNLQKNLIRRFKKGYTNRPKAIGDLIRGWLTQQKISLESKEEVGIITLLYHEVKATTDALLNTQHSYSGKVVSATHICLDPHIYLEVLIVKGRLNQIKEIADQLSPITGVKQVQLILITHKLD